MGTTCSIDHTDRGQPNNSQVKRVSQTRLGTAQKQVGSSLDETNVNKNKPRHWPSRPPTPGVKATVGKPLPMVEDIKSVTIDAGNPENQTPPEPDPSVIISAPSTHVTTSIHASTFPKLEIPLHETVEWTIPPQLAPLPKNLQDLLMGHQDEPFQLMKHPRVIHLRVITPGEDCMQERSALWHNVFMPLRLSCLEEGFTLDIEDDQWSSPHLSTSFAQLVKFQCDEEEDTVNIKNKNAKLENPKEFLNPDILLIVLKENFQPRLPCVLTHEDYMLVAVSLPDSTITALFHDLYYNNENLVPPAYELKFRFLAQQEASHISKLIDLMMGIFSREQKDLQAFYSSYQSQVFSSLNNKTLIANNTVVILKTVLLDDSHDEDGIRYLPSNLSHLMADVVKSVKIECSQENIVQFELLPVTSSDSQPDVERDNVMRIQRMCQEVKENLNKCLLKTIAHREVKDRDIATGVPKSLVEELVTQALYYQKLTNVQPLLESSMLTNLHDYACNVTAMPIIVQAEPGWGLSTMWAQLVKSFVRARPGTIFIYRSIGISPDSQTLLSTILSIQQQLDIILGPKTSRKKDSNKKIQVVETLLQDIVNRSTKAMPIMIILEGITLASSHSRELDILTFSQQLPATTKLVLMTSNSDVLEGLRAKMKDAFFLKTIKWDKETIVLLFNEYLAKTKHKLSEIQLAFVKAAIHRCPLPLYAVMAAKLAAALHNSTEVGEDVMPSSLDKIINIFFEQLQMIIPSDCFSAMMAYFTGSMGGICKWEMEDLLSVNDSVLLSINSDVKNPLIHRAPPVLWKSILLVFKPFLNMFFSQHFYSHSWASNSVKKSASARYVSSDVTSNILHRELSEHFLGRWSEKKKPYPHPEEEIELLQERFILPQPEEMGKHYNVRKFMCLPHHLMKSKNKNAYVLETCILSLSWLQNKINAVSVLQLVCDLELAKTMETSCSGDIQFMQEILLTYSSSLAPNGREVYKLLKYHITKEKKSSGNKKLSVNNNGLSKFYYSLSNPPWSFLCLLDSIPDVCSTPSSSVDSIVPLSHDLHETHVAIVLKSQGEIKIINIVTNVCVRTLTGLDLPQTLTILNSPTAVVLCNRELCIINLDEGMVVTKLRGVLNLRLPLFGLQNKQRVVVLSRDRMVVNILDIETDSIVASFKAGETRFLDSLILSEDGSVLVCGDETQKPFPLLVWSLVECKLLHDIRMAKHEFITQLAAISSDGHYLACGCREVDELDSNFVALFDLRSGHLMKKIRSDAMCTAVAVSSKLMSVVVVLDTGQLSIWDIISGNHRCLIDGAKVACDTITLTPDGKKCLTFCRQDMSISSRTISLWSIETGEFIASQTFDSSVTSAYLTPDGQMVLVGVKGHSQPIRLLLVPAGSSIKKTKKTWEMDSGSKVFGDIRRHEATINVAMTTDTKTS